MGKLGQFGGNAPVSSERRRATGGGTPDLLEISRDALRAAAEGLLQTDFFVGSFTRDTSLADGTQEITGLTFKPRAMLFFMAQDASDEASFGIDGGAAHPGRGSIADFGGVTAGTWGVVSSGSIFDEQSSGVNYEGHVTTFGERSFIITWDRTGAPTGTITVKFLAIR